MSHNSAEASHSSDDINYSEAQTSQTKTEAEEGSAVSKTEASSTESSKDSTEEQHKEETTKSGQETSTESSSSTDSSSSDRKYGPKEPLVSSGSYTAPGPEPVHVGDVDHGGKLAGRGGHELSDYDDHDHSDYHDHDAYRDDDGYEGYVDSHGHDFGRYH